MADSTLHGAVTTGAPLSLADTGPHAVATAMKPCGTRAVCVMCCVPRVQHAVPGHARRVAAAEGHPLTWDSLGAQLLMSESVCCGTCSAPCLVPSHTHTATLGRSGDRSHLAPCVVACVAQCVHLSRCAEPSALTFRAPLAWPASVRLAISIVHFGECPCAMWSCRKRKLCAHWLRWPLLIGLHRVCLAHVGFAK